MIGTTSADGPLAGGRLGRCEVPVVRILRRIHHGEQLANGRPLVDVDRHATVHRVLVDCRSVDNAGDGHELLTARVRSWADPGHQQRPTRQFAAGTARDEPLRKEHPQDRHKEEQQTEFPHPAMVGLLA